MEVTQKWRDMVETPTPVDQSCRSIYPTNSAHNLDPIFISRYTPISSTLCLQSAEYKGKGNVDLYSVSSPMPLTRSDINHTVLPANNAIYAFICKHSPGGATTHTHSEHLSLTYYSFIDPKRMNGWVGHVGWHTADDLTQGGHPSTARHGAGQGKFAGHRPTF